MDTDADVLGTPAGGLPTALPLPPVPVALAVPVPAEPAAAHAAFRALTEAGAQFGAAQRSIDGILFRIVDGMRLHWEALEGATIHDRDALEWRELRAEVAAMLRIGERAAGSRLLAARELVHRLPRVLELVDAGRVPAGKAVTAADCSGALPDDLIAEFEAIVVERIEDLAPGLFTRYVHETVALLQPSRLEERHRAAVAERRVFVEALPDGMAMLGLVAPAEQIVACRSVVRGLARAVQGAPDESRTLAQIDADVLVDLVTDSGGALPPLVEGAARRATVAAERGVRAQVMVHIPAATLAGTDNRPAVLEGYGPMDAATARRLAGDATSLIRVFTDPIDGTVVDIGRRAYRPPAELKRLVQLRDGACDFPGCARAAAECDLDHAIPWAAGGETSASNLGPKCRGHHRIKERGRWRLDTSGRGDDGSVRWTSPAGRVYDSRPLPARIRPRRRSVAPTPPTSAEASGIAAVDLVRFEGSPAIWNRRVHPGDDEPW